MEDLSLNENNNNNNNNNNEVTVTLPLDDLTVGIINLDSVEAAIGSHSANLLIHNILNKSILESKPAAFDFHLIYY